MKRLLTAILAAGLVFAALATEDAAATQLADVAMGMTPAAGLDAVAVPKLLSYQGKLTDTTGAPVPNNNYSVTFRLYTVPTGGSPYWNETQTVATRSGLFTVLLGAVTPIGSVPDAGALYLGMSVAGGTELTPRLRIVSAAYAYKADTANYALAGAGGMPDSVPGSFAVTQDLRVYGKGRIGQFHSNAGTAAFVAGYNCAADGNYSSVTGGYTNTASGPYAHIGGGNENVAGDTYAAVVGGLENSAGEPYAFAGGGLSNSAAGYAAVTAGGELNRAGATSASILGGYRNSATGNYGAVTGGRQNSAAGQYSVAGGYGDTAYAVYSAVLSGFQNRARDSAAVVCGGDSNTAREHFSFVGGGRHNQADSGYSSIGGGAYNTASGRAASVLGGLRNSADGYVATVGGGFDNGATAVHATVGGGSGNDATGGSSTIAGGWGNEATGEGSTVGGGVDNYAYGAYSTVPGGLNNLAGSGVSFAAGTRTRANHRGCFVWSDSTLSADPRVETNGNDQFRVRARGGTWFFSNSALTTGAYLAAGSNAWASACDSSTKTDFSEVDRRALLEKLAELRVREYRMRDQHDGTRHVGPVAQDFAAAFGYGENNTSINMADADGVLIAAVQALYEDNRELRQELEALKAELERK